MNNQAEKLQAELLHLLKLTANELHYNPKLSDLYIIYPDWSNIGSLIFFMPELPLTAIAVDSTGSFPYMLGIYSPTEQDRNFLRVFRANQELR